MDNEKSSEWSESTIQLKGRSGEKITFREIRVIYEDIILLDISVFLNWMQATVRAETTMEAVNQLRENVKRMIERKIHQFEFISATGHVSLGFALHTLGTIEVSGEFIKNSLNDSRVEFSFESDLTYLPPFCEGLSAFLEEPTN